MKRHSTTNIGRARVVFHGKEMTIVKAVHEVTLAMQWEHRYIQDCLRIMEGDIKGSRAFLRSYRKMINLGFADAFRNINWLKEALKQAREAPVRAPAGYRK